MVWRYAAGLSSYLRFFSKEELLLWRRCPQIMAKDGVQAMSRSSGSWRGRTQRHGLRPRSSDEHWLPLHRKPALRESRSNGSDSDPRENAGSNAGGQITNRG